MWVLVLEYLLQSYIFTLDKKKGCKYKQTKVQKGLQTPVKTRYNIHKG